MKKLLAIVLALMLFAVSAAFAETATVVTYSNPVITTTQNGETNTVDLSGLNLTVAMGLVGEAPQAGEDGGSAADNRVPTIQLDVTRDGETMLTGEVQFIGTAMIANLDGLSRPIALDLTQAGEMAIGGYRQMFAALPEIAKSKLPAFTGVQIPKVDLMGLVSVLPMLGIEPVTTENSASFELPAEMVNMLLQMILAQVPQEALASSGIGEGLNQLLASGGFGLKGDINDDGTTASLVIGVYPVQDGVTSANPFLEIAFSSAANADALTVDLYMGDQKMTLGQLAVNSMPDQAELDFSFDVMGGMISLGGSLYPQDGAQVAALELNIADASGEPQKVTASLIYGENEGADFTDFTFAVDGKVAADIYNETTGDGNGNASGTSVVTVDSQGDAAVNMTVSSDITQNIVEGYTFRNIENAAGAINAASMTEEESAKLQEEVGAAMSKLMTYFGQIAPAA